MNAPAPTQPSSLNLGDIYYVLFRHKWKILICTLLGLGAAAAVNYTHKPLYQSEAKLMVRYVISDNKTIGGPMTGDSTAKSPDQRGETIMNSEVEILTSSDLARLVVEAIGPERILAAAGGGNDIGAAVNLLRENLTVTVPRGGTVIHIALKHPDPGIVQPVLREIVDRYLKMHVEIHRASGLLGDLYSQETDRLRSRLIETEEELRRARNTAGVLSIDDAKKTYTEQISSLRQEIYRTQAELAARTAVVEEMAKRSANPAPTVATSTEPAVPQETIDAYLGLSGRISYLQKREQDLLTQFTSDNVRVRDTRAQLEEAEASRKKLLAEHPGLIRAEPATRGTSDIFDPTTAAVQIAALQSKLKVLNGQLEETAAAMTKVDLVEGSISELKRRKELQDQQYRFFAASLEQNRIKETLGSGGVSNISPIQSPSAPFTDMSRVKKMVRMIALAGLGLGLLWAFAIEFLLDRSVRRPIDIERLLRYPLLLTIPVLRKKQLRAASTNLALPGSKTAVVPAPAENALQTFHETLRDRLIAFFESKNLTHKPKLVAVSGMSEDAGVTTTAAGLARTLSETGEGNVLLVDMTGGQGSAQHFVKGKPACGLDDILDSRDSAHVQENLYVVGTSDNSDRLYRNLPQRFNKLVPKLKASDFDYIIFDMPPVSQISITPRLASFMDMVLLVVESEKTDREVLQRGAALLAESRAHVGVVLNKLKNYVPRRLQQELLSS